MRTLLLLLVGFAFAKPVPVSAQQNRLLYYFDNDFALVSKEEAKYMGIGEKHDEGLKFTAYQFPSGKVFLQGYFTDSTLSTKHGLFTHYDSLGFAESEGNYVNDFREGYWVFWDNGISDSILYKEGQEILVMSFTYHEENGALASKAVIEKMKGESRTYFWDTAGVLEKQVNTGGGADETILYYPGGKIKSVKRKEAGGDYTTKYFDESGKNITKKVNKQLGTGDTDGAYFPGSLDEPYYKAGKKELGDFIKRNLDLRSEGARTVGSTDYLFISFMLDASGRATDIEVKGVTQATVLKVEGILRRMTRWEMNGHTTYGPIKLSFMISNIY